ncbi:GNAT family N-acetyltransferase [Sinorhizobium numidicum]|uniref:GNAT family N-acetyltransferase n=1 Tax=Sinorhizobium numidicum TaxID=680248 RepID=A0ABY8CYA8_9HYPH|nr:GNAT family N-acetyltransferase [Sinorhizobium numidicum]WEX76915.1 GNAT family N-acetyltransferase [Sinorhizobium numidicum]WEX83574.1 GNAT family N-acetyltransferase [Sinorhizobium numidicum]
MEIAHEETKTKGRYTATIEGCTGEMTYSRSSPRLIIVDHTMVPDELRGKGVGQALAKHAIDEARKGGWKIIPLCPFMRAQAMRHPDWQDVIQA